MLVVITLKPLLEKMVTYKEGYEKVEKDYVKVEEVHPCNLIY